MKEKPKDVRIVPAGDDETSVIGQDLIGKYGSEAGAVAAVSFLVVREDGSLPMKGNAQLFRRLVETGSKRQVRFAVSGIADTLIGMYKAKEISLRVLQMRINKILKYDQEPDCNEVRLAIESLGDDGELLFDLLSVQASVKLGKPDLDYCSMDKLARYIRKLSSAVSYKGGSVRRKKEGGLRVSESLALSFTIPKRDLREVVGVVVDRFENGELVDDDNEESSNILVGVAQALINEDGEIPVHVEEALNMLVKHGSESAVTFLNYLEQEVGSELYD